MSGNMTAVLEAMRRRNLSYRDLAILTDQSPGNVWRVAKGERKLSREAALQFRRVLGLSYEETMGLIGPRGVIGKAKKRRADRVASGT